MSSRNCPGCLAPMTVGTAEVYCARCVGRMLLETEEPAPTQVASTGVAVRACGRLGDYELGPELGRGAMGVVYRARQSKLSREVAVKVILASRFAGELGRKRFLAEAELASAIDHPNIVPIYQVGETEDGPFYTMKLVEGGTLEDRLRGKSAGPPAAVSPAPIPRPGLPWEESVRLMGKIARAVHHAHQRGVLHRDLKPGNILIDERGEPHVTDFGLACRLNAESSITQTGSSLGTPAYMSPEQAAGRRDVTTAADVWSLGAILFHLLVGRPPFSGDTPADVLQQVRSEEPPSVRDLRPDLPRDLATICHKCLQKEPARRYGSALELAEDLDRFLAHEPVRARPVHPVRNFLLWCRRRPTLLLAWAGLATAVVAGVVAAELHWKSEVRERVLAQVREELTTQTLDAVKDRRLKAQPGRRFDSLPKLSTSVSSTNQFAVRSEAVACLALFDAREIETRWELPRRTRNHCISADLNLMAVGRDDGDHADLYRLPGGELVKSVSGLEGAQGWLQLSPDGGWLGARWYDRFSLVDLDGGKRRLHLRGMYGGGAEREFAFSRGGDRVAVRFGTNVALYELPAGRKLERFFSLADEPVFGIAFSPTGSHVAISQRTVLSVLDAGTGALAWRAERSRWRKDIDDTPTAMAWHPRGEALLLATRARQLEVWSIGRGEPPGRLDLPRGEVDFISFVGSGEWFLTTSETSETLIWDFPARTVLMRLGFVSEAVAAAADGRRFNLVHPPGGKRAVSFWEASPSPVFSEIAVDPELRSLSLSSDGQWVGGVAGSNRWVLFDTVTRRRVAAGRYPGAQLDSIRVVREHRSISANGSAGGRRWRVAEDQGPSEMPSRLAREIQEENEGQPTENEEIPAGSSGGDAQSPKGPWWRLSGEARSPGSMFVESPRGKWAAVLSSTDAIRLIHYESGLPLCDLVAPHQRRIVALARDDPGGLLVALTESGQMQLWQLGPLLSELLRLELGF